MRLLLSFLIFLICVTGYSQTFHKTYNFGQHGWGMSLALHGDNLVLNTLEDCSGVCTHVLLLSSLDGTLLQDTYFQDMLNEYSITAQHSNVRVGDRYFTSGGYQKKSNLATDLMVLIYDDNLDSVRLAHYQDSTFRTFGWTLVAYEDKIYSWGISGLDNQFYHGLLICSDLDGELLWMKRYTDNYRYSLRGSITNSHDGHLISTTRGRPQNEPYRAVVRKIDTEGNVLWKKEYAHNSSGDSYEVTLNKLGSNKYILIHHPDTTIVNWEDTTFIYKPAMAYILDEDGELLNDFSITRPFTYPKYQNVEPTRDGGAIAAGYMFSNFNEYGILTRFDSLGNEIWHKWYTHEGYPWKGNGVPDWYLGRFNKAIELPDGRLAVTGVVMHQPQNQTWLLVLDSMGCLEPGCADGEQVLGDINSTDPVYTPTGGMRLAPNPARAFVHIFIEDSVTDQGPYHIEAWNMSSQKMTEQQLSSNISDFQLSTATWPPGIYILVLRNKQGLPIATEKLVVE